MSKSDSELIDNNVDFGSVLAAARKTKNHTVDDVCKHLKISGEVIIAIESNDIENLPAVTFTQGYIRSYAKFLEIAEEPVLQIYNRAVPHALATDLKSRSNLPDEASSQTPLIKSITILLMLAGIAALIYGGFQYYQEKADDIEVEFESKERSFTGHSLDSAGEHQLTIKQNARLSNDGELIVATNETVSESTLSESTAESLVEQEIAEMSAQDEAEQSIVASDVIEIFAESGSWLQVRDATGARLFYNMISVGGAERLEGVAPFRVSLGNADTTRVLVNGIEVDMTAIIRPNNTAIYTVSTDEQRIVFH